GRFNCITSVSQIKEALRGDRLEDSPMRNSAVGYKPTVPHSQNLWSGLRGVFAYLLICIRRLPFNPFLAVLENLFLPDGHGLFKTVNGVAAGIERHAAVRRRDDDDDRGFRNFQRAEAVDDPDAFDVGPALANLIADAPHLLDGHRTVGFVLQA